MRTDDIPVLDLPTAPRERGRVHGEALRTLIEQRIGSWFSVIERYYKRSPTEFATAIVSKTGFRAATAHWTPDLSEEIAGIAQGARQSEALIFALQLMDEEWWLAEENSSEHCSSLAVVSLTQDAPTRVAQTQDLPHWFDGFQTVLRFKDTEGVESLIITSAGMIGHMGCNSKGVAVCMNSLRQLSNSRRGLPVACFVRSILYAHSHDEAVAWVKRVPHATAQNYLIADRHRASSMECSAHRQVSADEVPRGILLHTNHSISNDDLRSDIPPFSSVDSGVRLERLRKRMQGKTATLDSIKDTLASRDDPAHPISKYPGSEACAADPETFAAVIYELGSETRVHLCGGPPSVERTWRELELARQSAKPDGE